MSGQSLNWDRYLQYAALTDVGMRRANNQDAHRVVTAVDVESWRNRGHLFIVADGMGAHAAGELASKMACDEIPHLYFRNSNLSPPEALQKAIVDTNLKVHLRGEANSEFHHMGTTVDVLLLLPQGALVAHVGDSRVYRLRGEGLEQLTFDHSLVWEMRAEGKFASAEDAFPVVPKNVITRSLGPNSKVKVDFEGPYPIEAGDTFLLCTDGLTGRVRDEEIGPILANLPPREAAQVLVDLANLRGGPDNITVIVVKVISEELAAARNNAPPLVIGSEEGRPRAAHPAVWVTTGVCFLAALGLAIAGQATAALAAAVGGILAAAVGVLQQFGGFVREGVPLAGGRRLGKGPYTKTPSNHSAEVVAELARLVGELREAVQDQRWPTDWRPIDRHCQRATVAAGEGDHRTAVREYCQSVVLMMQELRSRRPKRREPSDSAVDL